MILAYIVTATFYSLTEAGFRVLTPMWIFLLLAVISASGVAAGLFGGGGAKILAPRGGPVRGTAAIDTQIPEEENAYTTHADSPRFQSLAR